MSTQNDTATRCVQGRSSSTAVAELLSKLARLRGRRSFDATHEFGDSERAEKVRAYARERAKHAPARMNGGSHFAGVP